MKSFTACNKSIQHGCHYYPQFVHEDAEAVSLSKAFQKTTLSSSLQHGPGLRVLSVLGGEDIAAVALAATEMQTRELSQSF